jgi:hypothetical protein
LQPRDKQILETVRKYRFITTKSLLMLYAPKGKGEKALRRRLALLFHHRYLTRRFLPPVDKGLGSAMSIYLLDTAGAEELLEAGWTRTEEGKRILNRRALAYWRLKHSLSISEFQLALDLALLEHEGCEMQGFSPDTEVTSTRVKVRIPRYGFKGKTAERKGGGEVVTVWPDAAFSIKTPQNRQFFFLEVDNADRKPERIFRRFLAYWQCVVVERELLRKKRGVSGAFVLFLSPDEKRRTGLIEIANRVPEIRRRRPGFWFLKQEDISRDNPRKLLRETVALGLDGKPGFLTKL